MHAAAPPVLYDPLGQGAGPSDVLLQYEPAGQEVHDVACPELYVPSAHATGTVAAVAE